MRKEFGATLAALRKNLDYKQVEIAQMLIARGFAASQQVIARWEKGINVPNALQFLALCDILHVKDATAVFKNGKLPSYSGLLNQEGREKVAEYERVLTASGLYSIKDNIVVFPPRRLPLYDLPASAGTGQFLDSSGYEMIEVDDTVPISANFGVRISGDSMEPEYHNGGIAWVQQQQELNDGEVGIFLHNGDAFMKMLRLGENKAQLVSFNSAYPPRMIGSNDEFRVFGKVVN